MIYLRGLFPDKKTNESKLQEIPVQPNEEYKKIPLDLRNKISPLNVCVKVWELVKAYDKAYARRKSSEERTQVFEFDPKIISKSLNDFYILLLQY